jgi:rfaE bifunctional protein nucleotidyltransferase chain/domain
MSIQAKIIDPVSLAPQLDYFRKNGDIVVFTNGCFDILHVGHVRYLAAAKSEGDLLVVGLNSDESVRLIKDRRRPIVGQDHRAEILASLMSVDYVTLFDEADPLKIIQLLKPEVLVKGEDWSEADIIGADFVRANGGRIVRIPLVSDASTSWIIQRIIEQYR